MDCATNSQSHFNIKQYVLTPSNNQPNHFFFCKVMASMKSDSNAGSSDAKTDTAAIADGQANPPNVDFSHSNNYTNEENNATKTSVDKTEDSHIMSESYTGPCKHILCNMCPYSRAQQDFEDPSFYQKRRLVTSKLRANPNQLRLSGLYQIQLLKTNFVRL